MRRLIAIASAVTVAFGTALGARVIPALAAPAEKIGYCHRSASVSNPYVFHETDADSIVKQGHGEHTGPIFPDEGPDGKWGDIIPPFDYTGGHFPGLNWNPEGETIVSKQCAVQLEPPNPPETTTTTTSGPIGPEHPTEPAVPGTIGNPEFPTAPTIGGIPEHPTAPTLPGTSTPSSPPTNTATTTTTPASSTVAGGNTSTTLPLSTTTITIAGVTAGTALPPLLTAPPSGQTITPPMQAVVVVAPYRYVLLGHLMVRQRQQLAVELIARKLVFTGSSETQPLLYGAVLLLLTGTAMVTGTRRRRMRSTH
jgi:hypothetical protein